MTEERLALRAVALKHWSQLEHFIVVHSDKKAALAATSEYVMKLKPQEFLECMVGLNDISKSTQKLQEFLTDIMVLRSLRGEAEEFMDAANKLLVETP